MLLVCGAAGCPTTEPRATAVTRSGAALRSPRCTHVLDPGPGLILDSDSCAVAAAKLSEAFPHDAPTAVPWGMKRASTLRPVQIVFLGADARPLHEGHAIGYQVLERTFKRWFSPPEECFSHERNGAQLGVSIAARSRGVGHGPGGGAPRTRRPGLPSAGLRGSHSSPVLLRPVGKAK